MESEIRNHWLITTSLVYTKRWWDTIQEVDLPKRITEYPGDKRNPFNSIDLPPKEYLENIRHTEVYTIENSIVNFITSFEVYLFQLTNRIIYLKPELIDASEMPFEANEIAKAINKSNFREWFSEKVTNKYIKNKTHLKMIKRLENVIKYELYNPNKDLIEEWNKWTYVRNAIVHNGRQVSQDLSSIWSSKFPSKSVDLNLLERDLVRVHYLAMEIAKRIDTIVVTRIIQDADANLLVRELFVRFGIDNSKELAKRVFSTLNHKLKTPMVDKCLGLQRRTNGDIEGWHFTKYNLE
ncbi:MAG: hypothetical protein H6603_06625 [Flavobacteriales bacterium]|nr:hypothetical protein [Flavobacteriales bacterium]MCB9190388.1 hypothetical protein [Flavobacteriales bacterium]MCB9204637.1 hypothetical protein [Flavobacteriales bacterium]